MNMDAFSEILKVILQIANQYTKQLNLRIR